MVETSKEKNAESKGIPLFTETIDSTLLYFVFVGWFGLVSLFNGISTFVGYLMPKPSL